MDDPTFFFYTVGKNWFEQLKPTRLDTNLSTCWMLNNNYSVDTSYFCGVYHSTFVWVVMCMVCLIIHETCSAIVPKLLSVYISLPIGDKLMKVLRRNGVSHNVQGPLMGHIFQLYINEPHRLLQQEEFLFCDCTRHNCLFKNICVGWPGTVVSMMQGFLSILCCIMK